MPVRWTAETDQILLLKILETSAISVDVKKVSAAWPPTLEPPTPRAISERLVRIRALAKSTNGSSGHFAVSNGKPSTPKSSPSKATKITKPKTTPKSGGRAGGAGKRKRGRAMSDEGTTSSPAPDIGTSSSATLAKKKTAKRTTIKIEDVEEISEDGEDVGSFAGDYDEDQITAFAAAKEQDEGIGSEEELYA